LTGAGRKGALMGKIALAIQTKIGERGGKRRTILRRSNPRMGGSGENGIDGGTIIEGKKMKKARLRPQKQCSRGRQ